MDAVEELALTVGMRSRRVLLDEGWWRQAAVPMIARVADRRRTAREEPPVPSPSLAAGTGWVALLPRLGGGYRMRALHPDTGAVVEWRVTAGIAQRLSPFAFAFHARLPNRALGAADILRFAFRQGGPDVVLMLLAGLTAALVGLLAPAVTGRLIDRAIPAGDLGTVAGMIAALAVAGVALVGLEVLRTIAVLRFESRIGAGMQAALVDRVVSAPAAFFRRFSSGDLAMRMGSVNTVQRTVTGTTVSTFVTSLFLLANLGLMLAYSAPLTLAASGVAILVVALSATLGLRRLRIGPRIEALDGKLGAMTFEIFAGIAKLRAAAAEARVFDQWHARYRAYREANRAAARLSNLEAVALSLLYPGATILVLALAWQAGPARSLSTGDFVAFHAAMFALLAGVHQLVSTVLEVVNLKPVWDRARPILETVPEDGGARRIRHEPRGGIAIENVSFAYPGGADVLHGVSLDIREGEFVAIVGASGSGKSTLLRLLLGFEAPREGRVRFDGHDLAHLDLRHLRSRMGTVLQGGRLWAGDLLTNILGASALDAEAAWSAARRAGLAADIEAMPMGLYTLVGEGLSTLSGGQRQRVLLARALVGDPRIVLLDEATSALDNVSQAAVLAELSRMSATRVVIAHRLNTVRDADRIVVLERGRIVQQGTFRELAAQRGAFSAMLARQVA
ncbi:MAG TPA: ATP-binding cassette domain-containing protein [Usitatibacter sp.]|nr:ATP-binding cassette domain-containing protein [Usitatibacter sp.]